MPAAMIIVGAGRVGTAWAQRGQARGVPHTLVTRRDGWEAIAKSDAPIVLAVRNDDLAPVVERIEPKHHARLVFTQNGMLRPWLASRGLENATRGLLFFAVPSRGAPLEPGGESPFVGPQSQAVVDWLGSIEVPATVTTPAAFAETELEKLIWNCSFGLLCEHTAKPVGAIVEEHDELLSPLIDELLTVGMPAFGLSLTPAAREAMKDRLRDYSRSIPSYRGAVKEWPWRNGWFVAEANEPGLHESLLESTGHHRP